MKKYSKVLYVDGEIMYKRILAIFVFVLVLFQTSVAYCKGTIMECDGYDTYIGMSKSEVQKLAKSFEKTNDDSVYKVDFLSKGDLFVQLNVAFNKYNKVCAVGVIFPEKMGEGSSVVFEMALTFLGINVGSPKTPRFHVFTEPYKGEKYATLDTINVCKCSLNDGLYIVTCYDSDESYNYYDVIMDLYNTD